MPLTVADLQAALALLPSDMPVIVAKDSEANDCSPLATTGAALYAATTSFIGDWYATAEQRARADDPDDYSPAPTDAVPALFLWPTS